jgi:hypothetical protein
MIFFSACGSSSTKKNLAAFSVKDLVGIWTVDCVASNFGQIKAYRIAVIQLTEKSNFIYENTHYSDSKCISKLYEESSKGLFELGDALDSTGKRIKLQPTEGFGVPRTDEFVDYANIGICGTKTWAKDQNMNLMGTGCLGWSESNATDGLSLNADSQGIQHIEVFSAGSNGVKSLVIGDIFKKDCPTSKSRECSPQILYDPDLVLSTHLQSSGYSR